jgi:hypothetical protein
MLSSFRMVKDNGLSGDEMCAVGPNVMTHHHLEDTRQLGFKSQREHHSLCAFAGRILDPQSNGLGSIPKQSTKDNCTRRLVEWGAGLLSQITRVQSSSSAPNSRRLAWSRISALEAENISSNLIESTNGDIG